MLGPLGAFGTPLIPTGTSVPTGAVFPFAGVTAPTGYLMCGGGTVNRTTYSALFAVIGVTYGTTNATNFRLPNLQDNVPIGAGSSYALADTGGETTHTLSSAEMPSHTHTQNSHFHTFGLTNTIALATGGDIASGTDYSKTIPQVGSATSVITATNNNTGGGGSHNNLQPYIALNYIIKT